MLIVLTIMYLMVCLYGIKERNDEDFLGRNQTNAIKGVFILMVFMSHVNMHMGNAGYLAKNIFEKIYFLFPSLFGQLMVVMFLFYSGYGVMESIKRNGQKYIDEFPKHRLFTTLANFDIAVLVFAILSPLTGVPLSLERIGLSLIGWDSTGNSNWYIFDILLCYTLTWIVSLFVIRKKITIRKECAIVGGVFVLLLVSLLILSCLKELWWYDTLLSYGLGLFFSLHKESVINVLKTHYVRLMIILILFFGLLYSSETVLWGLRYNFLSFVFVIIIIMLTMKFKIENPFIMWCGNHLFPIYIYMLVPVRVLLSCSNLTRNLAFDIPLLFVVVCLMMTLLIAKLYPRWQLKF